MIKKQISLLSAAPFDLTIQGRIVNWLTTWGRAILVLVELVVIGAFFSRFWLDRKNSDLSDDIRQKRAILESTLEFENEFRSLQKRFIEANAVLAKERDLFFPMAIVSRSLPDGITLKKFSFNQKEEGSGASLTISVFSERGLSSFIAQLLQDERVDSVRVGSIKKEKIATGIEIGLAINFKPDEKK
ncbi:hypothetical protein ISS42_02220 [Candidatus Shapirobacteria bacterium]|nr:hypothetical protein [Candidatus Shapirobacteria bacterium]